MSKKYILLSFIAVIFLAGCGSVRLNNKQPKPSAPTSGVFYSDDGGTSWKSSADLYTLGAPKKIAYSFVYSFSADPQDPRALYLATDKGIYYTYDGGTGWFATLTGKGPVNDVAVMPGDPCTIYAVVRNEVYKSINCSRSWERKHFSSLKNEFFGALHISHSNTRQIFVASSRGALLESLNGGDSWEVKQYTESPYKRFLPHPNNNDAFFAVDEKGAILATEDNGVSWSILNELPAQSFDGNSLLTKKGEPATLRGLAKTNLFLDIKFDESQTEGLIHSSEYGIFRLINGEYWQEIEILNKPRAQPVYSVAIDTDTGQTIYFATAKGFYRSTTAGKDWSVTDLPATGKPKFVIISSDSTKRVFISFEAWPQKK